MKLEEIPMIKMTLIQGLQELKTPKFKLVKATNCLPTKAAMLMI